MTRKQAVAIKLAFPVPRFHSVPDLPEPPSQPRSLGQMQDSPLRIATTVNKHSLASPNSATTGQ